jgi:YggT family protein
VFVASHLVLTVARLVELILSAYWWIIIARAVLSWVNPDPFNPIVRFLYRVTEPVLRPVRQWLPTHQLGLDLSPMVVMLAIWLLEPFLIGVLQDFARSMQGGP